MAANQCEGAYAADGKGWSIRDVMPQGIAGPRTQVPTPDNLTSVGIDFYHRYPEDIALLAEMGFTVFRTSIADRLTRRNLPRRPRPRLRPPPLGPRWATW